MNIPLNSDPTKTADGYQNLTFDPKDPEDFAHFTRDFFIEWQHGGIWVKLIDNGTTVPHIEISQLQANEKARPEYVPQGVYALDKERDIIFRLGEAGGGVMPESSVDGLPAAHTIQLRIMPIRSEEEPDAPPPSAPPARRK